ncbi:MAG TPA: hydroxymyristoyl-ACP dehydratase [Burkholderiaceae bacterium]|nr:hydroxymyristoyl-ACP dehydratase [Burkholderiaceae bacterium]
MCLLDGMLSCTADEIVCQAGDPADPTHPLRLAGTLPAACALEYASQAMALHGALCAPGGDGATPGFLASARGVQLHVPRLDDAPGPLRVRARRLASDPGQAIYSFELHDASERLLVDGRATVLFGTLLRVPPQRWP